MANRFLAALRTYTTRRDLWAFAAIYLVWCFNIGMEQKGGLPHLVSILFLSATPGLVVGMQLNLHFVNPQARLTPHFAAPHLLAAAAILAGAITIDVGFLAWIRGVFALDVIAWMMLIMAVTVYGCCGLSDAMSRFFVVGIVVLSLIPPAFGMFGLSIEQHLSGSHRLALAVVAGLALTVLAVLAFRLATLSEEMPKYPRRLPASIWDFTSRAGRRDRRQAEARIIARSGGRRRLYDIALEPALRWKNAPAMLRRLLLHRAADGFPGLRFALIQFWFVLFSFWLIHLAKAPNFVGGGGGIFAVSHMPVLMGMGALGAWWLRRWPQMASESLHPVTRMNFVRDLVRNGACDAAALAVGHCSGVVAGIVLFDTPWPMVSLVLPYLVTTTFQYLLLGCTTLWLMSFRRLWVLIVGVLTSVHLSVGLVVAVVCVGRSDWSPATIALTVLAGTAVAVGIYWLTLRRWLGLELD